jgi:hypothetical protein
MSVGEPCSSFLFVPVILSLKVDILVCRGAGLSIGESMGYFVGGSHEAE